MVGNRKTCYSILWFEQFYKLELKKCIEDLLRYSIKLKPFIPHLSSSSIKLQELSLSKCNMLHLAE